MNRDVFLSLLALDAYNRGYGQNVIVQEGDNLDGQIETNRRIGNATIQGQSNVTNGSDERNAGFYAIAYDWNGERVISFRGTNFVSDISDIPQLLGTYADISEGWSIFTGWGGASQAGLARAFLRAVTDQDFPAANVAVGIGNLTLTGHSLGGGLAGYIAARSLAPAVIFDPVPFGDFVGRSILHDALEETLQTHSIQPEIVVPLLATVVTDPNETVGQSAVTWIEFFETLRSNIAKRTPDFNAVTGYSVEGEIARFIDFLQPIFGSLTSSIGAIFSPSLFGDGLTLAFAGLSNVLSGDRNRISDISARGLNSGIPDPVGLHSMALASVLLFGDRQWSVNTADGGEDGGTDWRVSAKYVFEHLSDDDLAEHVGLTEGVTGEAPSGSQLASVIAYSAINEGTRVFGDTGIRAIFNDADEFGGFLKRHESALDEATRSGIGRFIIEFGGLLASKKILAVDEPDAANGIITRNDDARSISIDLSDQTWSKYSDDHSPFERDEFLEQLVNVQLAKIISDEAEREEVAGWFYGAEYVSIAIANSQATAFGAGTDEPRTGSQLVILDSGIGSGNTVGGLTNFDDGIPPVLVISGNGQNTFLGTAGDDVFATGAGSDWINGEAGFDAFFAGEGSNTLIGGADSDLFYISGGSNTVWGDESGDEAGEANNDTVVYGANSGAPRLEVRGATLDVIRSSGSDRLHSIENISISSDGLAELVIYGQLDKDLDVTISLDGEGTQLINASPLINGIRTEVSSGGSITKLIDIVTGGSISVFGFNTDIVGSQASDIINDGSTAFKVVNADEGDDQVNVGYYRVFVPGSGFEYLDVDASAIVFGGEGSDDIVTGSGDDFVIDQQDTYSATFDLNGMPREDIFAPAIMGSVRSGAGNDTIVVQLPGIYDTAARLHFDPLEIMTDVSSAETVPSYFLDPGEGDDNIILDGGNLAVGYRFDAGDGIDTVQSVSIASFSLVTDGTDAFGSLAQARFSITAQDYSWQDVTWSFAPESQTLVLVDESNRDFPSVWMARGTVTLNLGAEDKIILRDVFAFAEGQAGDAQYDLPRIEDYVAPVSVNLADGTFRTNELVLGAGGVGARSLAAPALFSSLLSEIQSNTDLQSIPVEGGGLKYLGVGAQNSFGGDELDRLVISWDMSALVVQASGDSISIRDKWDILGRKTFTGFDSVYVAETNTEHSIAEFVSLYGTQSENSAPVVVNPVSDFSALEDQAFSFQLDPATFEDPDGDTITRVLTLEDGSNLPDWLTFDGISISGLAPADFNGTLSLRYSAFDGNFAASTTFDLTIEPVNDAPVVVTPLMDVSSIEGAPFSFSVDPATFADVDGDMLVYSAMLSDGLALPDWITFDGASFTGTPPQDFSGSITLTVTASDGELSVASAFTLTIDPLNDPPVLLRPLADLGSPEDAAFSFEVPEGTFADVDGDALVLTATLADGSDLPAWLSFDGATFSGLPPQDFNGALDLRLRASDGEFSVTDAFRLTIDPVNDAPVLTRSLADVEASAGATLSINVVSGVFADIDGDTLMLIATLSDGSALPDWLTFDGSVLSATSVPSVAQELSITVTASDGSASVADTFVLTVIGGNSAPGAVDDGVFVTTSNRQLVIDPQSLLSNDSDPDGDTLQIVQVDGAVGGEAGIDQNGNIIFMPDAVFVGNGSFTYTVSDGELTSRAIVTVQVDPSNQFDGYRQGNNSNNIMLGSLFGRNRIFGAGGNDTITGGLASDDLSGGDGDDILIGLTGDDNFWGGQGNDILLGGFGFDTAHLFGYRSSYEIVTSGGIFNLRVTDLAPGVDGNDGVDQLSSIEQLAFKGGETLNIASPIILDLAGDGIQTLNASESNARFDLDGDGLADDTSWIGSNDAFLYLDRDGDGTMSGVEEISFTDDVENAATDLAGLRAFDSNGDGVLDRNDDRFADFGVWRDSDGDGAVDEGETARLAEVGIASINLTGAPVDGVTRFGEVAIANTGSFTLTNGARRDFADAALTYFSAASNLPELTTTHYDLGSKSDKYRVSITGGTINVVSRKANSGMDPLAGQLGANTILSFKNGTYGMFAPIVLDLDGDGVELVKRKKAGAMFDYNGDGAADDTGWIGRDDGFLVIDRNNDGLISEASELSLASESDEARSGLRGLAKLDSNGDGRVDADDARFGELRVWQDQNGNGRTEAGELQTLADIGIVSIRLDAITASQDRRKIGENAVIATASFVRSNGTTSTVADVSLGYRPATPTAQPSGLDLGTRARSARDLVWSRLSLSSFGTEQLSLEDVFDRLRGDSSMLIADMFDRFEGTSEISPVHDDPERSAPVLPEASLNLRQAGFDQSSAYFPMFPRFGSDSILGFARDWLSRLEIPALFLVDEPEAHSALEEGKSTQMHAVPSTLVPFAQVDQKNDAVTGSVDMDADLARKLMMIRQDLGAFGAREGAEAYRWYRDQPFEMQLYA